MESITKNKLDKAFGPVGTFAGTVLMIAGTCTLLLISWSGVFLMVLGAFFAFTSTSVIIDLTNKRVKFLNNICGIISLGRWVYIDSIMCIGIKKSKRVYKTYSRSNRALNMASHDFRVILLDKNKQIIMPLKKVNLLDEAVAAARKLGDDMSLDVVSTYS